MSSKTITQNDLTNILNEIFPATSDDMTPAQIEDFVQSLNAVATSSVDYIVEQGQSGDWMYRKWNSGIAECWWKKSIQVAANTIDVSNYISYPFTIYGEGNNSSPIIVCGLTAGGADLYRFHIESSTSAQARLALINKHTAAVNMVPEMYVRGTWK